MRECGIQTSSFSCSALMCWHRGSASRRGTLRCERGREREQQHVRITHTLCVSRWHTTHLIMTLLAPPLSPPFAGDAVCDRAAETYSDPDRRRATLRTVRPRRVAGEDTTTLANTITTVLLKLPLLPGSLLACLPSQRRLPTCNKTMLTRLPPSKPIECLPAPCSLSLSVSRQAQKGPFSAAETEATTTPIFLQLTHSHAPLHPPQRSFLAGLYQRGTERD